jgi:hypothetical protein
MTDERIGTIEQVYEANRNLIPSWLRPVIVELLTALKAERVAAFETEPVSPTVQAKTNAILLSGGTISAEAGKPMEFVPAAQDSVNQKLNGGESIAGN